MLYGRRCNQCEALTRPGWTTLRPVWHPLLMRLYGVRRLDWCGGLFYCHIWCKACRRHVIKPAHELAERYGWDKDIDWLMPRMVCTCGARNPWIITMSDPE